MNLVDAAPVVERLGYESQQPANSFPADIGPERDRAVKHDVGGQLGEQGIDVTALSRRTKG